MQEYYKTLNVSESASIGEIERAFKMKLREILSPLNQESRYSQDCFDRLMVAYLVLTDAEGWRAHALREGMSQTIKDVKRMSLRAKEITLKLEVFMPILNGKIHELVTANKFGFTKNLLIGLALFVVGIWASHGNYELALSLGRSSYTVYSGLIICGIIVVIKASVSYYSNREEIKSAEKEMWDKIDL